MRNMAYDEPAQKIEMRENKAYESGPYYKLDF